MKQILYKELNKQDFDIPKVLPNNLEKIKKIFSLKNSVIASALGFHSNFIGDVANRKANFSGTSVIKFIKNFNIPFNLIYNINSSAEYTETTQRLFLSMVQITKDDCLFKQKQLNGEILKYHIINGIIKDSDKYLACILKEVFPKRSIEYTEYEKKENYLYHLELINSEIEHFNFPDETSRYYILAYIVTECNTVNKFINLQENLDNDLMNYLNTIPYVSYSTKTIAIKKDEVISLKDKSYQLADSYNFLVNDNIVNTNIISKNMYTIQDNEIIITIVDSYDIRLNKLKQLREYKKYTPQDMANILCISASTYISIEKGHQKMSAQIMWKIEKEFGILLEQVLNIDEYYKK